MRPRRYPLDPLARLREKGVDDATKLLADAIRAREAAQRLEAAALARHDAAEENARVVIEGEEAALDRGELRTADLAMGAAWRARDERERAVLERRLARAVEGTEAASTVEQGAKGAVLNAHAQAEVVARDRTKWEGAERKRSGAAEEEAAAETFRKGRT
jgi:hypothetical protein